LIKKLEIIQLYNQAFELKKLSVRFVALKQNVFTEQCLQQESYDLTLLILMKDKPPAGASLKHFAKKGNVLMETETLRKHSAGHTKKAN